ISKLEKDLPSKEPDDQIRLFAETINKNSKAISKCFAKFWGSDNENEFENALQEFDFKSFLELREMIDSTKKFLQDVSDFCSKSKTQNKELETLPQKELDTDGIPDYRDIIHPGFNVNGYGGEKRLRKLELELFGESSKKLAISLLKASIPRDTAVEFATTIGSRDGLQTWQNEIKSKLNELTNEAEQLTKSN
ncbi:MAG: hypothetical protein AAGA30_18320, partial [Planctomycetota bacterium]